VAVSPCNGDGANREDVGDGDVANDGDSSAASLSGSVGGGGGDVGDDGDVANDGDSSTASLSCSVGGAGGDVINDGDSSAASLSCSVGGDGDDGDVANDGDSSTFSLSSSVGGAGGDVDGDDGDSSTSSVGGAGGDRGDWATSPPGDGRVRSGRRAMKSRVSSQSSPSSLTPQSAVLLGNCCWPPAVVVSTGAVSSRCPSVLSILAVKGLPREASFLRVYLFISIDLFIS